MPYVLDGALDRPGAECMRYVKSLFTMYPLDRFRPDLSVLFGINYNDASYITPVLAKDKTFIFSLFESRAGCKNTNE